MDVEVLSYTNYTILDVVGREVATVDKKGRTNRTEFDFTGKPTRHIYPDGTSTSAGFDANGNQTNSVDQLGRDTRFVLDVLGRQIGTIFAGGATNWSIPDDLGRIAYTVDARGTTNVTGYNVAGQPIAVTNALGTDVETWTMFGFDLNGNNVAVTNALGIVTINVFDVLNRQKGTLFPDQTSLRTGFDATGFKISETNQDGVVTLFGNDGLGRLISVTNALGTTEQVVTRYVFDEAGSLTAQIDALSRTNKFESDSLGRRRKHTMPGLQLETWGFDPNGNEIRHTNFNGVVLTNDFDKMDRCTNRSSVGYSASFAFSATGQRTNMIDQSGGTAYAYDNQDRLTNKVVSWLGGPSMTLSYRFDANGNLTNLWSSTSGGVSNFYQFDAQDRLTNVLANGNAVAGYRFDAVGNLQSVRYGNGVTNALLHDRLNRLTNLVWKANATPIASFQYQLAAAGGRTNASETVNGAGRSISWAFDSVYRLKGESFSGSTSGNIAYGFDRVGNRTNRTVTGSLNLTNQAFSYSTNDWLTTDGYDDNGNTTNSWGNFYRHDALNHVTNINNGEALMSYDGEGNRVKKTVGATVTFYLVDDVNPSGYSQVLEEWTVSAGTTNLTAVHDYGLRLISERKPGISTNYFVFDGHGSTRVLTDPGGSVVNIFGFDAYGSLIESNSAPQTAYLYAGEKNEPEQGGYYLRARVFNPWTGRFLTKDFSKDGAIGLATGELLIGRFDAPSSQHAYTFGENDPINNIDPSGHEVEFSLVVLSVGGTSAGLSLGATSQAKEGAKNAIERSPANKLRLSSQGVELISGFEGFRARIYKDPAGFETIGFGHKLKTGEHAKYADGIDREKGLRLLRSDARDAEQSVGRLVSAPVNQYEYDALVSLTYNIGGGRFGGSKLLEYLSQKKYDAASEEFLSFNKAGGKVQSGLEKRRSKERILFRGEVWRFELELGFPPY